MSNCPHSNYGACDACRRYTAPVFQQPIAQTPACAAPLALAGDVQGNLTQNTVVALQNTPITRNKGNVGQVLALDSSGTIVYVNPVGFGTISAVAGSGLTLSSNNELNIDCASLITHCGLLTLTVANGLYLSKSGGSITGSLSVTGATTLTNLSATGNISFNGLSGAGTRQVIVDATGNLTTQPISSTVYNGNNTGSGAKVFTAKDSSNVFQFKTLVAANSNTVITETTDTIIFNTLGEPNDATNLGTGSNQAGIYSTKLGSTLQLKSIRGSSNVIVTNDTNFVTISVPNIGANNVGANIGSTGSNTGQVYKGINVDGITFEFRSIKAGNANVQITQSGNDVLVSANNDQNLSYDNTTKFLSITNGTGVDLTALATGITVSDTSTADVTLTSGNLSVIVPFRINGTQVSAPTGLTPIGPNFTSSTLTLTNPSAGVINLETAGSGFSKVTPGSTAVTAIINTNTESVLFTGTFTSARDIILSATNATLGRRINISAIGATVGSFPLTIKDATQSNATIDTISTATWAEYRYDGTNWVKYK